MSNKLWAVHAQGPDEIFPAFDRDDAERHAAELNALPAPAGISVASVVIASPMAPAEHWLALAEQEREHKEHLIACVAPTDANLSAMRKEGLSIDGANAYKRDLLDAVVGALAFGKQRSTPPPAGHWLERFYEIGVAEADERDAAPSQPSVRLPDKESACVRAMNAAARIGGNFYNCAEFLYDEIAKMNVAPQAVPDMADAYVGAREDLAIWKRRALEAEQALLEEKMLTERLGDALNAENGPTFMGEPVLPQSTPQAVPADVGALVEALENIKGAASSVNRGNQYKVMIQGDDEPCFWQRKEWVEYLLGHCEAAEAALAAFHAVSAQKP